MTRAGLAALLLGTQGFAADEASIRAAQAAQKAASDKIEAGFADTRCVLSPETGCILTRGLALNVDSAPSAEALAGLRTLYETHRAAAASLRRECATRFQSTVHACNAQSVNSEYVERAAHRLLAELTRVRGEWDARWERYRQPRGEGASAALSLPPERFERCGAHLCWDAPVHTLFETSDASWFSFLAREAQTETRTLRKGEAVLIEALGPSGQVRVISVDGSTADLPPDALLPTPPTGTKPAPLTAKEFEQARKKAGGKTKTWAALAPALARLARLPR